MEFQEHFIESLVYEVELTSRIFHEMFKRWFEKHVEGISIEEFIILDTLDCEKNLSQIELANATLKGKAHTGKFLDSLEEKGLLKRLYDTKNSRMVKIPVMTDDGQKVYNDIRLKLKSFVDNFYKKYSKKDMDKIQNSLENLRKHITEVEKISFN